MYSEITASFTSLDSAEYAARSVKESFSDIIKMSIKYKNANEVNFLSDNANDFTALAVPFDISSGISSNSVLPSFRLYDVNGAYEKTESDFSLKSKLLIICKNSDSKKISSKLRAFGGTDIKVQSKNM